MSQLVRLEGKHSTQNAHCAMVSQYREDDRHIFLRELFLDIQVCDNKIFLDPPMV